MRVKLENTQIVYHQETDSICVMSETPAGAIIHPVTGSALHSLVAWTCADKVYEPRLYRWLVGAWRWVKVQILRREVSQGRYERIVSSPDGYLVMTCEHFAKEPPTIPFLTRKVK